MNPRRGAVDLQRAAVKHFGEAGSHLEGRAARSQDTLIGVSPVLTGWSPVGETSADPRRLQNTLGAFHSPGLWESEAGR